MTTQRNLRDAKRLADNELLAELLQEYQARKVREWLKLAPEQSDSALRAQAAAADSIGAYINNRVKEIIEDGSAR